MVRLPARRRPRLVHLLLCGLLIAAVAGGVAPPPKARRTSPWRLTNTGTGSPARAPQGEIRVHVDDLVRITFSAEDIPHSFTIDDDHYRISRRAEPGKPPTRFEFRADKAGTFEIYCNLSIDPRCRRETIGRLIVEEK